ncbi:hypothetical protein [Thiohalophilus thiocyanatoxydans]|uniref:Uncharacterized protein n=1 Tax=Thiohalophilus thiocyanatoxydans TaxID=381308 RepID=A0A4R8IPP6_9GAMM|nr:hypothetical protein [Thiohalophilus thiocyanatoxydans]TDY02911.1 hypothetical protein EDC23_1295 [Thiohalophilus thiocyanatoxydans]
MLVTDGNNELLLWFHRHSDYWEATLLDSIKTENHRAYGVNPLDLRIHLRGNTVLYGREGSEAITGYEWDEQRHVFLPFTVSGN